MLAVKYVWNTNGWEDGGSQAQTVQEFDEEDARSWIYEGLEARMKARR